MISETRDFVEQDWQKQLANGIKNPQKLLEMLDLTEYLPHFSEIAQQEFSLKVPHAFVSRMKKGDISDPLLRQVLPIREEENIVQGYMHDPLQEKSVNPMPGLLQKYHGRVLLTLTGTCAIHCRYCFRRHFPYAENTPNKEKWLPVFEKIAQDPTISEVIFSGGDPLILNDKHLAFFFQHLSNIPHIKRFRIHTRLPIVLPDRITPTLLDTLPANTVIVIHSNHPQELDDSVKSALFRLRNFTVLNQTVLLKGINDSAETLAQLSESLFEMGVLPYYLHQLDKVQGAAHFWVDLPKAKQIIRDLTDSLPGYLVPKFVREVPGELAKQMIPFN